MPSDLERFDLDNEENNDEDINLELVMAEFSGEASPYTASPDISEEEPESIEAGGPIDIEPVEETMLEETAPEMSEEDEEKKGGFAKELYGWAQDLVGCLIFIVVLFIFVIRVIGVDGSSMYPTLEDHDMLALLSNVFYTPKAGDIVVVTKHEFSDQPIVKRVIAIEGQTVDVNFETGEVWVDGVLQDEPYINETTERYGDVQFPVTIPEGHIFVMGDNRNHSTDSRWSVIGMIDERCVLGKALMVVFPFNRIGRVG